MPSFHPDVAAYLRRIGYAGPVRASLECLQGIQRCHTLSVPFENIDVVEGRGIPLEGANVERKLVRENRGGYCFEQNGYMLSALREIGFRVMPYMARPCWNVAVGLRMPRTHLALRVEAEGTARLFDVAFGGLDLSEPLLWDHVGEQPARDGRRRLTRRGPHLVLQASLGGDWADVYEISPDEAEPSDWEVANWFTSSHPQSRFRQNLIIARSSPEGRKSIFNRDFTIRRFGQEPVRRTLESPAELIAVLGEHFGLKFPEGTRFGNPGSAWPS